MHVRYLDEYRDGTIAARYIEIIKKATTREWTIMEICGGQTHTIVKSGIESVLPQKVHLVHGPGCPVCVTPVETIDKAVALASMPDVILASFGDMLRVPGSTKDLLSVKAEGGDVRMVYSPLDALRIARSNPDRHVVFFAVGFETTAPATAMAVREAMRQGLRNFSLLSSHVLVPPAITAILSSPTNHVQAVLAAGHVCTVVGFEEYIPLAATFRVPIVVTGFEPVDILQGICMTVTQLEAGKYEVENQYGRAVRKEGNLRAKQLLREVFEVTDRTWRGIGTIPASGFGLKAAFERFDAEKIFSFDVVKAEESPDCIAGEILQGWKKPYECPAFGRTCVPEHPLGAPMVSSEGACAAYYHYTTGKASVPEKQEL